MNLHAAVDKAIDEMPEEYSIKRFLIENRAEEKSMFLTEYNEEKVMEKERQEGIKEGIKEGTDKERERVAVDMIKEGGLSASFIARISKLSEETVRKLAKSHGVAIL